MSHDHLCFSEEEGFRVECARLEVIREDERYRVVEQIMAMDPAVTRDTVADAVKPVSGDPLRKREPRAAVGLE